MLTIHTTTYTYSSSDLYYLTTFLVPRKVDDYPEHTKTEWENILGGDPLVLSKKFTDDNLILKATLQEHLRQKHNSTQLRDLLKNRNLSTSGSAEKQLLRLIQHDPNGLWDTVKDLELLKCSEKGERIARQYLDTVRNPTRQKAKQIDLRRLSQIQKQLLYFAATSIASGIIGGLATDVVKGQLIHPTLGSSIQNTTPTVLTPSIERDTTNPLSPTDVTSTFVVITEEPTPSVIRILSTPTDASEVDVKGTFLPTPTPISVTLTPRTVEHSYQIIYPSIVETGLQGEGSHSLESQSGWVFCYLNDFETQEVMQLSTEYFITVVDEPGKAR